MARMFQVAFHMRNQEWEENLWWWEQCSDLEFYDKMQTHMDICDNLKVFSNWSFSVNVVSDVLMHSLRALIATWKVWAFGLLVFIASLHIIRRHNPTSVYFSSARLPRPLHRETVSRNRLRLFLP